MTDQQHTPERFYLGEYGDAQSAAYIDCEPFAVCSSELDARRTVASLNNTRHLHIDNLEALVDGTILDYQKSITRVYADRDRLAALNAELVEVLEESRDLILSDYEISNNEAHHDGHHIAKVARALWDKIHTVLAKAKEADDGKA